MVAQWTCSNDRPLRRLCPHMLFALALVADRRTRLTIERELDFRFFDRDHSRFGGRFRQHDLLGCKHFPHPNPE